MQTLKLDFQEGDLPSLHPHDVIIHYRGISIAKSLYEGLTRIDATGQAKLTGAKSVEVSSDRLRYTFTLRDNSWSDGTPVTAFHYENAWKEALSPTSLCPRPELLYMIKNAEEAKKGEVPIDEVGVKAVNAQTLVVDLAYPSPYFLELLAQPICMPLLHPSQREMTAFNGPFMVSKWEKGNLLQLKQNPKFWNRKQVSIQQIDIYMIQESNTAFSLFQDKKIDYIGVPLCILTPEQVNHLDEKRSLLSHTIDRVFWIHLNTQHAALSSPLIRQALAMSIPREPLTKHIVLGGTPLLTPLPNSLLPTANTFAIREDVSEARKKFEKGLKELKMTRENFPTIVISYSQQANRKQVSEYLQDCWSKNLGIKVELESKEWNTLRSSLPKGLYEIACIYRAPYYKDPMELLDYFTSMNNANFPQWVHPRYSEKVQAAKQEKEFRKRTQLLVEAEQFLTEQMPIIPLCTEKLLFATNHNLQGYVYDCLGTVDFSYATINTQRD